MPKPFSLMLTMASFKGVPSRTAGRPPPLCIMSATRKSRRLPRLPAGWLKAKSSGVNARARSRTTANASPKAMTAVVLVVGASPSGQASLETDAVMWMSAWRAMVESGRAVMQTRVMSLRLSAGMMAAISSLSPELEIATTTSLSTIMPKSPCAASAGWTKNAGVPVEAMVAAILRPICPDLPMPVITTLPLQCNNASAPRTKFSSNSAAISRKPSASVCNTSRAQSRYFSFPAIAIRLCCNKTTQNFRIGVA